MPSVLLILISLARRLLRAGIKQMMAMGTPTEAVGGLLEGGLTKNSFVDKIIFIT